MKHDRSRKRQRGSVLVETGMIFTIFAFLVIGAFDFGQFLFVHQALVERTRNAARWGAVNDPTNATAIQNMVFYNQPTAPSGASPYFGLTTDMVKVTNPGGGTVDNRVVVQVTNFPYTVLSPYIGGSYTGPNITISIPLGQ